jgi:hypothetical protein
VRGRILAFAGALAVIGLGAAYFYSSKDRVPPHGGIPGSAGEFQKAPLDLNFYTHRTIGRPPEGLPWISDLLIVDLDGDGLKDVLVANGKENKISWIRQVRPGVFEEQDIGDPVAGPAHIEVADLRGTGHLDVLVASMGVIPPDNEKIGSVVVLENDGTNHFTNHVLLDHVARVTYVKAARLTQSGRLDLVVGQFGYAEGEIRWMENLGGGQRATGCSTCPGRSTRPSPTWTGTGSSTSSRWSRTGRRRSTPS